MSPEGLRAWSLFMGGGGRSFVLPSRPGRVVVGFQNFILSFSKFGL